MSLLQVKISELFYPTKHSESEWTQICKLGNFFYYREQLFRATMCKPIKGMLIFNSPRFYYCYYLNLNFLTCQNTGW